MLDPLSALGVKLSLKLNSGLPALQKQLRLLQNLLSFYGLIKIDCADFTIEWLPDNEVERGALPVFEYKQSKQKASDEEILATPYDLFARAVIASRSSESLDLPLSFFRRGMLDFVDHSYIEAIYDFYFMLETLFSDGRFRRVEVERKFKASKLLTSAIVQTLGEPGPLITGSRALAVRFQEKYGTLTVEKAVHEIVRVRGTLHHHTIKRRGIWHPDEQNSYELDAMFLQQVAFNIAFELARQRIWDERVLNEYEALRLRYQMKKPQTA